MFVNAFNATCTNHDERAALLGSVIRREAPDIVMLQEMWGGGQRALERALTSPSPLPSPPLKYALPLWQRSWWGLTLVDTAAQFMAKRGGLWYAFKTRGEEAFSPSSAVREVKGSAAVGSSAISYPFRHTFSFSNSKSKKGVCVTKFTRHFVASNDDSSREGNAHPTTKTLLVFNTHLDPTNENRGIERQLVELGDTIRQVVSAEARAAHQRTADISSTTATLPFAAVIVGDFNITPSDSLYTRLLSGELLDSIDGGGDNIASKAHGGGARQANPHSIVLKELISPANRLVHTYDAKNPYVLWPESAGRLDHVFAIDAVRIASSDANGSSSSAAAAAASGASNSSSLIATLMPITSISDKVIKEPIVSDHYPICVDFTF